jgi:hypothetical protein
MLPGMGTGKRDAFATRDVAPRDFEDVPAHLLPLMVPKGSPYH